MDRLGRRDFDSNYYICMIVGCMVASAAAWYWDFASLSKLDLLIASWYRLHLVMYCSDMIHVDWSRSWLKWTPYHWRPPVLAVLFLIIGDEKFWRAMKA